MLAGAEGLPKQFFLLFGRFFRNQFQINTF